LRKKERDMADRLARAESRRHEVVQQLDEA
jgi:hypothetical protein